MLTSAPASYCLPAAQMRVVDTALLQFEALKPVVVRLRQTNGQLRRANGALRVGLTQADSSRAFALRALALQQRVSVSAEATGAKYQAKSTARGWTIAGLAGLLLGGVLLQLR